MTAKSLKQAALTLFAESGYDGVSLSEIAKSVGIKTPSIYAHFESKEQLFLALLDDAVHEEHEKFTLLLQNMEDQPPIERFYAAFRFFTDLDGLTNGQSFLKRTMLMPPRNLEERLRSEFIAYEDVFTGPMLKLLRECAGTEADNEERVERLLALFYAVIDGLLVEHKLYDTELYRRRQTLLWGWLQHALRSEQAG
ncbi:TetR family transcriptional regulator [Paenibacillus sacheonensis]|uniref:TetR family transcriptional regulator n=1 Tax=Paenibacillus sacheonensis TaxID=742054 RepID=A0A7X4YWX9_9BACL|nr:TetR/AcrR family transcriptional regulator [Paenibacillus sacheonensis]MBM7566571.1 AcrR family transcriptional regulator [Paenibacillus sacheonensis]NBC73071.1 TetR family transcriptional regulator [Paenibacillus sacheonensis]